MMSLSTYLVKPAVVGLTSAAIAAVLLGENNGAIPLLGFDVPVMAFTFLSGASASILADVSGSYIFFDTFFTGVFLIAGNGSSSTKLFVKSLFAGGAAFLTLLVGAFLIGTDFVKSVSFKFGSTSINSDFVKSVCSASSR